MKVAAAFAVAAIGISGARVARTAASELRVQRAANQPYAPSASAAPFVSLGYREAAADVLFVRLRGYFGDDTNVADTVAGLCEAIIGLDERFERVYEYCTHAMTLAKQGVDEKIYMRAIALLERGSQVFPENWRIPNLAGQIYTQDLHTDDPLQRRAWDEKGTRLVESAIRKPGAPAGLQDWAAVMRTKFGQRERAMQGIREVLLLTNDASAKRSLIDRLARLESEDADEIAGELYEARRHFEQRWHAERPALPASWYIILGGSLVRGFDMADLATGGHELFTLAPSTNEPLQP